jgi:hypothetical protein
MSSNVRDEALLFLNEIICRCPTYETITLYEMAVKNYYGGHALPLHPVIYKFPLLIKLIEPISYNSYPHLKQRLHLAVMVSEVGEGAPVIYTYIDQPILLVVIKLFKLMLLEAFLMPFRLMIPVIIKNDH